MRLIPTVAVAALLVGCGGGEAPAGGDDSDAARVKLNQCLREQGLDVPDDPAQGGAVEIRRGANSERAMEACADEREAAFGEITPEQREEFDDAFAKFASCMRREGVDLPDPDAGEPVRQRFDANDPTVLAAQEACRDEMPEGAVQIGGPPR